MCDTLTNLGSFALVIWQELDVSVCPFRSTLVPIAKKNEIILDVTLAATHVACRIPETQLTSIKENICTVNICGEQNFQRFDYPSRAEFLWMTVDRYTFKFRQQRSPIDVNFSMDPNRRGAPRPPPPPGKTHKPSAAIKLMEIYLFDLSNIAAWPRGAASSDGGPGPGSGQGWIRTSRIERSRRITRYHAYVVQWRRRRPRRPTPVCRPAEMLPNRRRLHRWGFRANTDFSARCRPNAKHATHLSGHDDPPRLATAPAGTPIKKSLLHTLRSPRTID
jgi:hypothetical protein